MEAVISTKCPILNVKESAKFEQPISLGLEVLVLFEKGENWLVPSVPQKVFGCPAYDNRKCIYTDSTCNYLKK